MKNKMLIVTVFVFVLGVVSGVLAYGPLVTPASQPTNAKTCRDYAAGDEWNDTDNDTRCRMAAFQHILQNLETQSPDTLESLNKELQAQALLLRWAIVVEETGTASGASHPEFSAL